jgi:hypothetical protein
MVHELNACGNVRCSRHREGYAIAAAMIDQCPGASVSIAPSGLWVCRGCKHENEWTLYACARCARLIVRGIDDVIMGQQQAVAMHVPSDACVSM